MYLYSKRQVTDFIFTHRGQRRNTRESGTSHAITWQGQEQRALQRRHHLAQRPVLLLQLKPKCHKRALCISARESHSTNLLLPLQHILNFVALQKADLKKSVHIHTSNVACQSSHATRHTPHATRHTLSHIPLQSAAFPLAAAAPAPENASRTRRGTLQRDCLRLPLDSQSLAWHLDS